MTGELYGEAYYRFHCGPVPLERSAIWLTRSGAIAENIIRGLKPHRVLDAGCAMGLLVESLWDKGVEASGIDISPYAISKVRLDLQKQCRVAPITEPLTGRYDLVTCIEVLEHLPEAEGMKAIENLISVTDTILFSSDPYDFVEPTHVNVRPLLYWINAFAAVHFYPDLTFDATFVAAHAMLFRKATTAPPEDVLQAYTELIRHKIILANQMHQCAELSKQVGDLTAERNTLQSELQQKSAPADTSRLSLDKELQPLREDLRRMETELAALREKVAENEPALDGKAARQKQIAARVSLSTELSNLPVLNGGKRVAELTTALDRVHSLLHTLLRQHGVSDHPVQETAMQRTLRAGRRMLLAAAHPTFEDRDESTQALASESEGEDVSETFRISFDDPSEGADISRDTQMGVVGWAVAESGIWALDVFLDGTIPIPSEFGRRRPDVLAAFPNYTQAGASGFSATLDTSSVPEGQHFVLVIIHTKRGNVMSRQHDFKIVTKSPYEMWLAQNTPSAEDLEKMKEDARTFAYQPLISIVTPLYRTPLKYLEACVESVFDQVYGNWQLCLVDDGSADPNLVRRALEFQEDERRVKFRALPTNSGISVATNACLDLATGEYVAFLDHDDTLSNTALYEVVKQLNLDPQIDVLYSDEDKISIDNRPFNYFFKPEWSPELFLSCNYICHFLVIRRKLVEQVGGLRTGFEGSQDYDLALRVTEYTNNVRRIPKILYHWRSHPQSTASATDQKPTASRAGFNALTEHLQRTGQDATVIEICPGRYRIQYRLPAGNPEIRIVIPTGGNKLLKDAVRSLLEKSTYRNFSIVVVDNSPDGSVPGLLAEELRQNACISVLDRRGQSFNFSALCNAGVKDFKGDYLLFLNDDTTIVTPEWLEVLLEHAQRKPVGAVGSLLLFPDLKIQHAGVLLGIYGIGGHAFRLLDSREHHYFMFPEMTRNCSAVTGACLMTRRQCFEEVGGFDEENLPTCFQDVDYCLKLIEKDYRIVYTPFAKLLHHESASKNSVAEGYEIEYMHKRWGRFIDDDPYYNPNLSRRREDYSLNFEGSTE